MEPKTILIMVYWFGAPTGHKQNVALFKMCPWIFVFRTCLFYFFSCPFSTSSDVVVAIWIWKRWSFQEKSSHDECLLTLFFFSSLELFKQLASFPYTNLIIGYGASPHVLSLMDIESEVKSSVSQPWEGICYSLRQFNLTFFICFGNSSALHVKIWFSCVQTFVISSSLFLLGLNIFTLFTSFFLLFPIWHLLLLWASILYLIYTFFLMKPFII